MEANSVHFGVMPFEAFVSVDIEEWYIKYCPMVLRRCRALLRNEEQAVEAMQDVFIKLLASPSIRHDSGPSSLLYQMATQVCLNLIRSSRRRPQSDDDVLLTEIASMVDWEDGFLKRQWLGKFFQPQDDKSQLIAVLHFVDGMTLEEVAREVGLSVSGVRKKITIMREQFARQGLKYEQ